MTLFQIFLISFGLFCFVSAHPTHYLHVSRNETCYSPTPATIYSWHIHFLYWQINERHTAGAFAIRNKFIEAFKDKLGPNCTDLFHQPGLCMFDPDTEPVGPFLTAQWAIFVPTEYFSETVQWAMQNRGIYDVLVHPNSGCELEDHSWWAMWGGKPWEINLDAMSHDQPFPWPESKSVAMGTTEELLKGKETPDLVKKFLVEHES